MFYNFFFYLSLFFIIIYFTIFWDIIVPENVFKNIDYFLVSKKIKKEVSSDCKLQKR